MQRYGLGLVVGWWLLLAMALAAEPPPTPEEAVRVDVLAERYHMPGVEALIQAKQRAEHQTLEEAEAAPHLAALERLDRQLDAAHERSILPASPSNQEALEQFVVEMRLHRLCGGG
jgi:hypothetical protein